MRGEIDSIEWKVAAILIGTNDIGWLHRTAADNGCFGSHSPYPAKSWRTVW